MIRALSALALAASLLVGSCVAWSTAQMIGTLASRDGVPSRGFMSASAVTLTIRKPG